MERRLAAILASDLVGYQFRLALARSRQLCYGREQPGGAIWGIPVDSSPCGHFIISVKAGALPPSFVEAAFLARISEMVVRNDGLENRNPSSYLGLCGGNREGSYSSC